jgi:hypothetical protein
MYGRTLFFLAILGINYCFGMDVMSLKEQHIIFLNGTTTAGKTTIAAELKNQLEAQSFAVEVLAIDSFVVPKVQWALGCNRLNPFNCFVPNIDIMTPSEMEAIGKESQLELCIAAKKAYDQGKIVIVDAPIYQHNQIKFYREAFDGLKSTWALVYRSLPSLVDGIIARNQKGGLSDRRSLLQGLYQFSCMYCGNAEQCINKLSQNDLHASCNQAQEQHAEEQEHIFDFLKSVQHAICPFSFKDIRLSLFENLSLNENTVVEIGPKIQHDCIVNTELFDSAVSAQMIISYIFKGVSQ